MTVTRRTMLTAGVTGATAVLLAACGSRAGAPAEAVAPAAQIRKGAKIVWAIDNSPATRTALREAQIKMFHEKFPDIGIEQVLGATGPEKLLALFAAGTPPDMFRQEAPGMALFGSRNQIEPLDPYIKRDKYDLSDYFPSSWLQWTWKGKRLGVPFQGIVDMFWNRTLAQQVNVKIPTTWKDPSWTWDAFLEACKRATIAQGNTATRWGTSELYTNRRQWSGWVWGNGGELFDEEGTKVLLDQPPAMEAIQFLGDLIHKHRVQPTPDEIKAQGGREAVWTAGSLLIYPASVNNVATNRRTVSFDWSLTGVPKGKGKMARSSGGGVGWFLTASSTVKDEVWELMKVLSSKESVKLEAVSGEAPPSRRSVAADPEFVNPPEPPRGDMKVIVEALESVHTETALINGVEIDSILDAELGQIWSGQRTARESVEAAVAKIKPLLNPAG